MSGHGRAAGTPVEAARLTGAVQEVAPRLLGCVLAVGSGADLVAVRIDEVEAYAGPGEDPGSHAHRGPRPRCLTMFAAPGSLYVYFTYGLHHCANVVVHPGQGGAGAVLVRAGEVVAGLPLARERRPACRSDRDLARGPARLTRALALDAADDGRLVTAPGGRVRLLAGDAPAEVGQGPRVGVAGEGAATPWRWWDARRSTVSAYRAAQPRRRARPSPPRPAPHPVDADDDV